MDIKKMYQKINKTINKIITITINIINNNIINISIHNNNKNSTNNNFPQQNNQSQLYKINPKYYNHNKTINNSINKIVKNNIALN